MKIKKSDLLSMIQEQNDVIAKLIRQVNCYHEDIIRIEGVVEPEPQLKQLDQSDDTAKELLEIDLSSELTGSDYYYSNITSSLLESGSKLVVCFVSNVSESDALSEKHIEVITSLDTSFNDSDGYGWQYAVPINNQGEPLTASEAGL